MLVIQYISEKSSPAISFDTHDAPVPRYHHSLYMNHRLFTRQTQVLRDMKAINCYSERRCACCDSSPKMESMQP